MSKSKISFLIFALLFSFLVFLQGCKKEATLPSVETLEIYANTTTSIFIRGNITDSGNSNITEKGFVGCTIPDPSLQRNTYLTDHGEGGGFFEGLISNVTPGTWYVKAYAVNEVGVVYGEEKMINTIEESIYNEFTMGHDDYMHLVVIDPIPHETFNDFAYYYGASAFYENFDFRLEGRRLKKDDEGMYLDPELGEIFEDQGIEAATEEMFNRLLYDGLIEVLRQRYPNARPKIGSYETEYNIEFETFGDNWVIRNPIATFRCTASGTPPDFELIDWYKYN